MTGRWWWVLALVALCLGIADQVRAADPLDLNRASVAELTQLPGIGPKRAQEIVRYRETRGFRRPADLMRIKGIGGRTYLKLKPFVCVNPRMIRSEEEVSASNRP